MKPLIVQNNSRFTAIKRRLVAKVYIHGLNRLVAKVYIHGLNLVFLVFAPDRLFTQADSSNDDCAIGISSEAEYEHFQPADSKALLDANSIKILSWNIKKGQKAKWDLDLQNLSFDKDLVFLQEANLTEDYYDVLGKTKFRDIAQGWKSSGVLTAAAVKQVTRCAFRHTEPILRTPKATLLSEYQLKGTNQTLLTVNVHMVNFSIGITEYKNQLLTIRNAIARHTGPVIISGDFNTWLPRRLRLLNDIVESLDLARVIFDEDSRSRAFGCPLDHIFVRGLQLVSSKIEVVQSSDHNALSVELTTSRSYATR
ncbi:endonuclease/exonuclease/phosphatase family protein [Gammaproteobacteria bacterium]|nr:endonuclease/exonuclease/phosphatase family protein [Gammaproteobacteria bacterium]